MLYGSETWVMTLHMGRVLEGFHHRVSSYAEIRQPWRGRDRVWVYPPLEDMMAEFYFKEMDTYLSCFEKTVTQFITTRPIWTCVCQWIGGRGEG